MTKMNITVSKTVWVITQRIKISSRPALQLAFAAIIIILCGLSSSCMMAPMAPQQGGQIQQQQYPQEVQEAGYNGGGGLAPVSGPQIDVQLGQMVSNQCFGSQPVVPPSRPSSQFPEEQRKFNERYSVISWVQATGPETIWVNDFGHGRAQIQRVPDGEEVIWDNVAKCAWRIRCHNRVKPIPVRHQQIVVQRPPIVVPAPAPRPTRPLLSISVIQGGYKQSSCQPVVQDCRRVQAARQPRLVFLPQQQCGPQGYNVGGYQQQRGGYYQQQPGGYQQHGGYQPY